MNNMMDRHNNDIESSNWYGEKYGLQKDPSQEGTQHEVPINQEKLFHCMDKRTPIRDCGDLTNYVDHKNIDHSKEVTEQCRAASTQSKRRRILQFHSEAMQSSLRCEETSSTFFTSNMSEVPVSEDLLEASQRVAGCSEGTDAPNSDGMNAVSDELLDLFLNDVDVNFDTDDFTFPSLSEINSDIPEFGNGKLEHEAIVAPKNVKQVSSNIIFKELSSTSSIQTPTNTASPVAYPFGMVKPSEAWGDVTLMDINQRICNPPMLESKYSNEETFPSYPKSAITGKPVAMLTHIRTEGGKGSITIRRTLG